MRETKEGKRKMEIGNMLFGNSRGRYPINREAWQYVWCSYFANTFDEYGYYIGEDTEHTTDRGGYENDTFIVNPYYWGDDENIAKLPNFLHKPTGFEIQWYKYPMRDAYMNIDMTLSGAAEIFRECVESMRGR